MMAKSDRMMRKRIVTGLAVVVAIGAAVFFLLQPKKGSLEWHKQQYLAAANRLAENRFYDRLRRTFYPATGKGTRAERRDATRMEEHRKALVELGYLVEQQFALKYRAVDQVKVPLANALVKPPVVMNGRFWISTDGERIVAAAPAQVIGHFSVSATRNTIVVTAPGGAMGKFEEWIQKSDVR
jgi:hypothetical protein